MMNKLNWILVVMLCVWGSFLEGSGEEGSYKKYREGMMEEHYRYYRVHNGGRDWEEVEEYLNAALDWERAGWEQEEQNRLGLNKEGREEGTGLGGEYSNTLNMWEREALKELLYIENYYDLEEEEIVLKENWSNWVEDVLGKAEGGYWEDYGGLSRSIEEYRDIVSNGVLSNLNSLVKEKKKVWNTNGIDEDISKKLVDLLESRYEMVRMEKYGRGVLVLEERYREMLADRNAAAFSNKANYISPSDNEILKRAAEEARGVVRKVSNVLGGIRAAGGESEMVKKKENELKSLLFEGGKIWEGKYVELMDQMVEWMVEAGLSYSEGQKEWTRVYGELTNMRADWYEEIQEQVMNVLEGYNEELSKLGVEKTTELENFKGIVDEQLARYEGYTGRMSATVENIGESIEIAKKNLVWLERQIVDNEENFVYYKRHIERDLLRGSSENIKFKCDQGVGSWSRNDPNAWDELIKCGQKRVDDQNSLIINYERNFDTPVATHTRIVWYIYEKRRHYPANIQYTLTYGKQKVCDIKTSFKVHVESGDRGRGDRYDNVSCSHQNIKKDEVYFQQDLEKMSDALSGERGMSSGIEGGKSQLAKYIDLRDQWNRYMEELKSELEVALRKVGEEQVSGESGFFSDRNEDRLYSELGLKWKLAEEKVKAGDRSKGIALKVLEYATNENRKSLEEIEEDMKVTENALKEARKRYEEAMKNATNRVVRELRELREEVTAVGGVKDVREREYNEAMVEYEKAIDNWDRVKREQVSIRGEFEERQHTALTNYQAKRSKYADALKEYYSNYGVLEEKLGEKKEVEYWMNEYREYGGLVSNRKWLGEELGGKVKLEDMEDKILRIGGSEVSNRGGVIERVGRVISELVRREVGEKVGRKVMELVVGDDDSKSNAAYRVIRGEYGAEEEYRDRFEVSSNDLMNALQEYVSNNLRGGNIDWDGVRRGLEEKIANGVREGGVFEKKGEYYELGRDILKWYEAYVMTFQEGVSGYSNVNDFNSYSIDKDWRGYVRGLYERGYSNEWKSEGEEGIKHLGIMGAYENAENKVSSLISGSTEEENDVLWGISNEMERLSKEELYTRVGMGGIKEVSKEISNVVRDMKEGMEGLKEYVKGRGGNVYGVVNLEVEKLLKAIKDHGMESSQVSNMLDRMGEGVEGNRWSGEELSGWISELENLEDEWELWSKVGVVVSNRMAFFGEIEGVEGAKHKAQEIESEVNALSKQWGGLTNIEGMIWGLMDPNMSLGERIGYYVDLTNEIAVNGVLIDNDIWKSEYSKERSEVITSFADWLDGRNVFEVLYGGEEKMRGLLEIYRKVAGMKEEIRKELEDWNYAYNYEKVIEDLVLEGKNVRGEVSVDLGTSDYESYYMYRLEQLGRRTAAVWKSLWQAVERLETDRDRGDAVSEFVDKLKKNIDDSSRGSEEELVAWVSSNYEGVGETNEWYSDAMVQEYSALETLVAVEGEATSIAEERGVEEWRVLLEKAFQQKGTEGSVRKSADGNRYTTGTSNPNAVNNIINKGTNRNKEEQAEYYEEQIKNVLVNAFGEEGGTNTLASWLETSGEELAAQHATNLLRTVEGVSDSYLTANSNYLWEEKQYNQYYEEHYIGGLKEAKVLATSIESVRDDYEKLRAVYEYGLMLNLAGANEDTSIARKVGRELAREVERTNRLDDPLEGISKEVMGFEIDGNENEVGVHENRDEVSNRKIKLAETLEEEMIYQAYGEYQKSVAEHMWLVREQERLSNSYRGEREAMKDVVSRSAIDKAEDLVKWGDLAGRMEVESGKLDYEVGVYDKEYREAEHKYKIELAKLVTNGDNSKSPEEGYRAAVNMLGIGELSLWSDFNTATINNAIAGGAVYLEQMKRFKERYDLEEGGRISNLRRYEECRSDAFDYRCQRFIDRRRAAEREKARAEANFYDMKRQYEKLLNKVKYARDDYTYKKDRNETYSQKISYRNSISIHHLNNINPSQISALYKQSYQQVYDKIINKLVANQFMDISRNDLRHIVSDSTSSDGTKYTIATESKTNSFLNWYNLSMVHKVTVSATMKEAFNGYVNYLKGRYESVESEWKNKLEREGAETNRAWEESSDDGYKVAMSQWASDVGNTFGYMPNVVNLEEAEAVYRKLMLDIIPIAGGSALAREVISEYTKVLNTAHKLKQMQVYTLQKEKWDEKENKVLEETQKYINRINALVRVGEKEWGKDLADFESKWAEWDRERMNQLADGELAYRDQLGELRQDEKYWNENAKTKWRWDLEREGIDIRKNVEREIGVAQRKAAEERRIKQEKERQDREERLAKEQRELEEQEELERKEEATRIAAAQKEAERLEAIAAANKAEEVRKKEMADRKYKREREEIARKQKEEREAEEERERIAREVEKLNFAIGDRELAAANRKQFIEDIDSAVDKMYSSYRMYVGNPKEMKEVLALQSMEIRLKDKFQRINKKYVLRTPRVRDYYAMTRISFQPTSADELEILEDLNRQVASDNEDLMKLRLFEMMEEFHREQSEFIEDRHEEMNLEQDFKIASEYMFVDIHEQMSKLGVSDGATKRKLERISDILRNHQLYGEYGVKYRNDEEVSYERNYISDASLFLESVGEHSLVGFRYAQVDTYLMSPLSDWNKVEGMSYLEMKVWQVGYQQRLSEDMGSIVNEVYSHFSEDFERFMGEYGDLFGKYMAGVAKADMPFWEKKIFLGDSLDFLSLGSIFDFAMGVASVFSGGTTLAFIGMAATITETMGNLIYYEQDADPVATVMGLVMPAVSLGIGMGFDEIRKGIKDASVGIGIALKVGESTSKISSGYLLDFTLRGAIKGDWSFDGGEFAKDLAIGGVTSAAIAGMSSRIESQTGSKLLAQGASVAARGGITAVGNTVYGEITGRRKSGFMATTGLGMRDFGELAGSGISDIEVLAESQRKYGHYETTGGAMKQVRNDRARAEKLEELATARGRDKKRIEEELLSLEMERLVLEKSNGVEAEKEENNPFRDVAAKLMGVILVSRGRRKKGEDWEEEESEEKTFYRLGTNLKNGEEGDKVISAKEREMISVEGEVSVKVNEGDTLSKIAQEYGVTLDELLKANPQITDPNKIYIGDSIKLPDEVGESEEWTQKISRDDERDEWERVIIKMYQSKTTQKEIEEEIKEMSINLTEKEKKMLAATVYAESSGDDDENIAITYVILNRLKSGKWGNTLESVLSAKNQINGYGSPRYKQFMNNPLQSNLDLVNKILDGTKKNIIGDGMNWGAKNDLDQWLVKTNINGKIKRKWENRPTGVKAYKYWDNVRKDAEKYGATNVYKEFGESIFPFRKPKK